MDFDPEAFGERLRALLDKRGMSIRQFQQAVEERAPEVKGTSYYTIYYYYRGQGSLMPREGLIEAMAEVLGVRIEYLRDGRGAPTEEEETARLSNRAFDEELQTSLFERGWERSSLHALIEELGIDGYPFFLAGLRLGLPELDKLSEGSASAIYLMEAGWQGFEDFLLGPLRLVCRLDRPSTPRARMMWSSYLRTALLAVEMALDARDEELGRDELAEAQGQTARYLLAIGQEGFVEEVVRRLRRRE